MITQMVLVCWFPHPDVLRAWPAHLTKANCHDCQRIIQIHNDDLEMAKGVERKVGSPITRLCIPCTIARFRLLRPHACRSAEGCPEDHLAMFGPSRAIAQVHACTG